MREPGPDPTSHTQDESDTLAYLAILSKNEEKRIKTKLRVITRQVKVQYKVLTQFLLSRETIDPHNVRNGWHWRKTP